MSDYLSQLLIFVCVFSLLALSLNLIMGYGGLFSIAQACFYGVGAYTVALTELHWHWGFAPAFLLAMIITGLVGALTAIPALRLRGDYLVIASLATQVVGSTLFENLDITNGPAGLRNIPQPRVFNLPLDRNVPYLIFSIIILVLVFLVLRVYVRSPWGRLLLAIRDDDVAAVSLGKNVVAVKVVAFAIAAAVAGLAGGIYADFVTYISPDSFTLDASVSILVMAIIGGTGNLYGSVLGGAVIVGLPEILRRMPLPASIEAQVQLLVYGALLVIFMMFRPQGLIPERTGLWRRGRRPPLPPLSGTTEEHPKEAVEV